MCLFVHLVSWLELEGWFRNCPFQLVLIYNLSLYSAITVDKLSKMHLWPISKKWTELINHQQCGLTIGLNWLQQGSGSGRHVFRPYWTITPGMLFNLLSKCECSLHWTLNTSIHFVAYFWFEQIKVVLYPALYGKSRSQLNILFLVREQGLKACFRVHTMFYDWFWVIWVCWIQIWGVPPCHSWGNWDIQDGVQNGRR